VFEGEKETLHFLQAIKRRKRNSLFFPFFLLAFHNLNDIVRMPRSTKRAHDFIDLTGDDESETRQKRPALNGPSSQHQHQNRPGQGGTSVYGSGSSSQNVPSSTAEPDYLDLTQDDEGPPLELYGTFRKPHTSHITTQVHYPNIV
jgi:hypothetical protein